ncbi:Mbov_0400 family ICE element protein, partial [Mycoplasmopsis agalactiae]
MFGKLFKVRSNKNDLPIAINSDAKIIDTFKKGKIHRPYVVFYSNDYVYYLSVKSITKKNQYKTTNDDRNVIVPNRNIYGKEVEIGNAIN